MQEQPSSLVFRQKVPKSNGLIWGTTGFRRVSMNRLLVGKTVEDRQAGVRATVARFFRMLQEPLTSLPHQTDDDGCHLAGVRTAVSGSGHHFRRSALHA